ncbi:MAG: DUF881 domain-containing protein [Acidobacteria bacterium]|nr:DUF881 domain-containing protein [Acidobacteriota bacterium]
MTETPTPPGRPQPSRPARSRVAGHATIAAAVALLGFLLATQLQVRQGLGQRLASEREVDLVRILGDLSARSDDLLEEIVGLRLQLAEAAGSTERAEVLARTARQELTTLEILLGTIPVEGPGIRLVITDPQGAVGPDVLLDVLQELRDAGAEAVQINDLRAVASTALSGQPGHLLAAGQPILAPYVILAIGGGDTLAEAMRIPGGVVDSVESRPGAHVSLRALGRLRIGVLRRTPTFSYARPEQRGS